MIAADGANSPSLAVRDDGHAFAAWYDGTNALFPNVNGAVYDPATGSWSAPEQLNEAPGVELASSPAVALDAARVVVVWQNGTNVNNDYDYNVFERSKAQ